MLDRATGAGGIRNIRDVFAEGEWNTLVDAAGDKNHEAVEQAFSHGIETPVAPAFQALRAAEFPLSAPDREQVAVFMSAQLVRGRASRANLSEFIVDVNRTMMAMKVVHYSDERWVEEVGFVPSVELKDQLLHSEKYFHLKPTTAHLLETQLSSVLEIAGLLHQRTWTLVRFSTPCLFTGEEPVIHINPHGEQWGYGVVTAEQMYMPVTPSLALVLSHPWADWPEAIVTGARELAQRLNWAMLSYPTNEHLLLHPDVEAHPLPGPALLARGGSWPWPPDPQAEPPVWLDYVAGRRRERGLVA